jgi:uncharacterized protein (TIGR00369 family)
LAESDRDRIRRFADSDQREPFVLSGSPLAVALGASILKVDKAARRISVRFTPGEQFLQGRGVLQGGTMATMLDFSMAFICISTIPDGMANATASLTVAYLKPAVPGVYICDADIERLGRTLAFTRASVRPEQGGDAVASATAVFSIFSTEKA